MKSSLTQPIVFVSMPIGDKSDYRYQHIIKPACETVGATCERLEDVIFQGHIVQEIYSRIARADALVVDVTKGNPNVWFELGYAQGLGKRTLLLADSSTDIPFDLTAFRVVFDSGDPAKFGHQLVETLRSVLSSVDIGDETEPIQKSLRGDEPLSAIVFGDIVSSTRIRREIGDLDFDEWVKGYFARVSDLARIQNGHLVKTMGDSFLATFDTVETAINFGRSLIQGQTGSIQAEATQTRLAVHLAPVRIMRTPYGDDITGAGVVLAVRLASIAGPGEIALSESALNALPTSSLQDHVDTREIQFKGLPPVSVVVLSLNRPRRNE